MVSKSFSSPQSGISVWHGLLLAALLVFQSCYLLWWLRSDTRPPGWDESHHLLDSFGYRQSIASKDWEGLIRPVFANYPPLYHLSLAPFLKQTDDVNSTIKNALKVNVGYLCLLILSVYFLGEVLVSSEVGLCAATISSFAPVMLWLAHRPLIDMPLAAWVALSLLCLVMSNYFERPLWSLALGLSCGAGMMAKWTFIIYAGVPVAWGFFTGMRIGYWRSLFLFLLGAAIVAGPWYAFNGVPSFFKTQKLAAIKEARDPDRWSVDSATWYWRALADDGMFWPLIFAAAIGFIAAFFQGRWLLFFWAIVPWAVFSSLQNKDLRYAVPIIPALSIMLAAVAENFSSDGLRRAWLIGWAGLAVFIGVAYGAADRWPAPLQKVAAFAGLEHFSSLRQSPGQLSEMHFDNPVRADWKTEEILKYIEGHPLKDQGDRPCRVSLIANHLYFHTWAFRIASKLRGWNNIVISNPKDRLGEFSDYILWKTGDMGPEFTLGYLTEAARLLKEQPLWLEKTFSRAAEWPLPDGSQAILFKRDVKDVAWPAALGEVDFRLERFPLPRFEAQGLRVRFMPASAALARKGEFSRIVIECDRLDYRGLVLENVRVEGRDVQINLPRLLENKELFFFRLGELRPSVQVASDTLVHYLQEKARWLKDPKVSLDDGRVQVSGRAQGLPLTVVARAELAPSHKDVTLILDSARVGPVPLPLFLIRAYARKTFSLEPSKDLEFPVRVDELSIKNGQLTVRSAS